MSSADSQTAAAEIDRLFALAKTHECQCGKALTVAVRDGAMTLVCPTCGPVQNPERLPKSGTAYYGKRKAEWLTGGKRVESTALTKMTDKQMLERIEQARFPQELKPDQKLMLATAAISYGFDPLMKEITVFQGNLYVSIDGRYRKAQESGFLDGVETRPATDQERKDWKIPPEDYFFRSEVYRNDASHPFVGWGRVYAFEVHGGKGYTPVEKNPQRMAEKRAEAQALRKAFHIPLPSVEDLPVADSPIGPEPPPRQPSAPRVTKVERPPTKPPGHDAGFEEADDVDPKTGEIIAKKPQAAPPAGQGAAPAPGPAPAQAPTPQTPPADGVQDAWEHLTALVDEKEIPRAMIANKVGDKGLTITDWKTAPENISVKDIESWTKIVQTVKAAKK